MHQFWASVDMWVGDGVRWGGWWQQPKQRTGMIQVTGFRMAMTCTCT